MARYRKIDPRIWNDEKFRALSDSGKLAFLFLLTHPHMTSLGAMRATPGGLAEELGWNAEAFREAFREALSKGMAEHDPEARMIALPNFIRYNPPESPNVIKAWLGSLDLLPECSLKVRVVERAKAFAEGLGEAFREALPEAFAKTMPNQEQEQEQKQKKVVDAQARSISSGKPNRKPSITLRQFLDSCKAAGEKPILAGDPIFDYAEKVGIAEDMLTVCWKEFRDSHLSTLKRKADWRAHYRNAVRRNWYKLWFLRDGEPAGWTTAGEQARRAAA